MIVELNLTQIIFILIALFSGGWAMARVLMAIWDKGLDRRFNTLTETLAKDQETTHRLEREFLQFQSEIPRTYLRRDDYMREVQILRESISAEIVPMRKSINRIEDFLIQK
jgi:hypothetical protein